MVWTACLILNPGDSRKEDEICTGQMDTGWQRLNLHGTPFTGFEKRVTPF